MKTIYYNGKVYTGTLPLAQAFVEENGIFLYAGDSETAKAMAAEGDKLIDLENRFVCSGFNDSHMHLLGFGKTLRQAQLARHTDSLAEMVAYLKAYAAEQSGGIVSSENETPAGSSGGSSTATAAEAKAHAGSSRGSDDWILGRGWNQDFFADADRMPDRHDLDKVSTKRPVCIVRACGHCLVVNSRALEILGITGSTSCPEGGRIGMEGDQPDGRFYDNAMELVYAAIPAPDKEEIKEMIRAACSVLNSYGITSCQSDDYCAFQNVSWKTVNEAFMELEAAEELTVRVNEQSNLTSLEELKEFVEAGNVTGTGGEFFRFGPLKMLGDGALGARTAFLSQPYADDPTTCGIPVFSKKTFEEMIGYAHEKGMQAAVHTIGDACLDWVLEAYEKALEAYPRENHRHGIVHCQITRPDQLKKIADLKLHVYAQSIFLDYDINIVEVRVGKELASTSYSWKTLADSGVTVSNGSDCPVELPDVMAGIQCAVTRQPLRETAAGATAQEAEAYLPHERFTIQEALDSFTINGAKASFEEGKKGRIEKGMLADFVILEKNPFAVPTEQLKDIRICGTYLGGRKV